ncbi:MAG: Monomeric sarcosine oxidase [Candidatus Heimdallarchaeota archaeon LC_2]|nr:MAG: Monomeric sarcosine oxidase [Candidatus Heimdallarchaeota archaeon LC_2]
MKHFDVIVIGAGAMGSATTYYLAKSGKKVLLLEQFEFLHPKGSSHGESRIIRRAYPEKHFADLMLHAYDLWNELERETMREIIKKTGGLDMGHKDNKDLNSLEEACKSLDINYEKLDAENLRIRFPNLIVPEDYAGIYQSDAGIINATQAVSMFQELARGYNAQLVDYSKVERINTENSKIEITANQIIYTASKLIITSGAWINSILALIGAKIQLDVDIWKMTIAYWKVLDEVNFTPPKFPIFINWGDEAYYGFPIAERENYIKIGPHYKSEIIQDVENKSLEPNQQVAEKLSNYVSTRFRNIESKPIDLQSCLYTMTSDENFIVDFHPDNPNIIIGAGFSGHGFKFTPLIGKMISQMVIYGETNYDRSQFGIQSKIKNI